VAAAGATAAVADARPPLADVDVSAGARRAPATAASVAVCPYDECASEGRPPPAAAAASVAASSSSSCACRARWVSSAALPQGPDTVNI
jgi:hypothetical protein